MADAGSASPRAVGEAIVPAPTAADRYAGHVLRLRLLPLLVVAALLAACGASVPASEGLATPVASAAPSSAPSSAAPSSATPPSVEPTGETPVPSEAPTEPASPDPSFEPSASAASTAADACSGSADNRKFFANLAGAVDWPVLCAVLPKGWFVNSGSYRLANGGKLTISYKGPGGATLALSEGAFCQDADGCVPSGGDAGEAALGPLSGTLVKLNDGGWAIVADRGASLSWLLVAHGLDEASTTSFGSALVEVAG